MTTPTPEHIERLRQDVADARECLRKARFAAARARAERLRVAVLRETP